ncbi:MAG: aspartate kinase [Chloroflexi bacterium]|nr:aspartate kinase [Chloroflexota bacterium]
MKTLVMKFGGTSMGSAEAIGRCAEIVRAARAEWPRVAVVVSAMSGVTDALLKGATTAAVGDSVTYQTLVSELRERHTAALAGLADDQATASGRTVVRDCLDEFFSLCHAVRVLGEASPRALDAISSLGERMSIHLIAMRLNAVGVRAKAVDAADFVVTDSVFLAANPQMDATKSKSDALVKPLLDDGIVPVITGFIGADASGAVTTLGRGGSDFSAAIVGVVLGADEVWIWTDVDGVMTADPRVVKDARSLEALTYREVAELAYYGAKVLHPKTIRPVIEIGSILRIKNTFNPTHPGTRIVADEDGTSGTVKAVTAIKSLSLITVEGRGMIGVPGVAARTFGATARTHTSVLMISQASSEQSICFLVPSASAERVVAAIEQEFALELARRDIDKVWSWPEVVIVTVVGAGMQHTPGIAGRVFSALGAAGINVIAIAQGSSECSISLVVDAKDADQAVRELHKLTG